MKHHHDRGYDSEFNDARGSNRASYESHPIDSIEPIDPAPNGYRSAALAYLKVMLAVDEFITAAEDVRGAVVAVAIVLGWPSTRGLSVGDIAGQFGCSRTTISRACARFREMAGLDSAGGVRFIRPGAGSNGDKPTSIQAQSLSLE